MHVIFPILHWTLVISQLIHMDAGHVKNMNSLTVKGIYNFFQFYLLFVEVYMQFYFNVIKHSYLYIFELFVILKKLSPIQHHSI